MADKKPQRVTKNQASKVANFYKGDPDAIQPTNMQAPKPDVDNAPNDDSEE